MQLRSTSRDVFCFVEYKNSRACEGAIREMNNREFDGSRIVVDWSNRNQKQMGGSRSHDRSRRRRSVSYDRRRSRSRDRGDRRRQPRNTPAQGKYKCELENLPPEMTWMDLKNLARKMRGGNEVTFARTYEERGMPCGILEFESKAAMKDLMKHLDGKRINGHKVRIVKI